MRISRRGCPPGSESCCAPTTARSSRCRARRPRGDGAACPRCGDCLHVSASTTASTASTVMSAAPAIPARTGSRSRSGDARGAIAERLLDDPRVKPIGLGARDSLRLEAGLCLYGHDIDETTSPVEAALTWSIQKRRREEGGFPGAARVRAELADGPARVRVGLSPKAARRRAKAPKSVPTARRSAGSLRRLRTDVGGPIAMGYVERRFAAPGTAVALSCAKGTRRHGGGAAVRAAPLFSRGKRMTTRYTKDHEWISVEGDIGTVGITGYAQCSSATLSLSSCPRSGRSGPRAAKLPRRVGEGGERGLCAGERRGRRDQP